RGQAPLGATTGVPQPRISSYVTGKQKPTLETWQRIADGLHMPTNARQLLRVAQATDASELAEPAVAEEAANHLSETESMSGTVGYSTRASFRATEPTTVEPGPGLSFSPVALPDAVYVPALTPEGRTVMMPVAGAGQFRLAPVTSTTINATSDAAAMRAFRAADMQIGGGSLYSAVVKYLHTEVAPRMFGSNHDHDGKLVFTAAAALTEMAGWMAHDAGRDNRAQQHFTQALNLVKLGADRQLEAHTLASMSHLAHHAGQPAEAVRLARAGQEALHGGPRNPDLEARLLAMEARGHGALRQPTECRQVLNRAERALSARPDEPLSQWVSRFDEGSLASEAARCMRQVGDLPEAQRQAERIIKLRPLDRTRSRAFGQLILVTALIGQGKLEEACAVAQQVVDSTQSLSSYLVIRQLLDLQQHLEPHRASEVVAGFLLSLEEALRERLWLYRWLTTDGRGGVLG
ncbi:MAG: helix-turn-helix domain-containing protein, partial [Streptomycetales bacterium]